MDAFRNGQYQLHEEERQLNKLRQAVIMCEQDRIDKILPELGIFSIMRKKTKQYNEVQDKLWQTQLQEKLMLALKMKIQDKERVIQEQRDLVDSAISKHKQIRDEEDVGSLGHDENEWAYSSMLSQYEVGGVGATSSLSIKPQEQQRVTKNNVSFIQHDSVPINPEDTAEISKLAASQDLPEFAFKDTKMGQITKQPEYRALFDTHRNKWYNNNL